MSTFTTPHPITAALTTAGARVRIAAGERAETVVRVQPVDAANSTDVKVAEKTRVEFADGVLSVKTTKSGRQAGSVDIAIELPAGSKLLLNTAWTEVRADGALGDCEVNIGSGRVQLDRVDALRGNLGAGGLAVGHVAGGAVIEGSAAVLRIGEVDGQIRCQGTSGKVWIGRARSDVDLGGSNGSFDIGTADGSVVARAADCPIRIGRVTRGLVELSNAAGGIEVGVSAGTTADVDAKSAKGAVRNTLGTPDSPRDTVKVHARARLGDIVVHSAA
ncbi:hypothetical protein G3I59_46650 [Amycolatopsis rubida]|uniref:Adhesin domain-containing protein n=1 Tax=Amycolatopsis rubida TaxID=112413 RepID=A0A1I5T9E2_9PSEU|nr:MULTISPECIES: hypothetical protein [Amycolatopsis]MYW97895.1 hypothetical protein [Amycolatopsis rubida]NEC62881.1 hypothetical protein [Amycolatopsis rubida]OAP23975.1 hypothetical protein A4R44_05128 [Amycolatopsis sp. M39]SFP79665.1 hypothetical protein SAMN05421854_10723 [Amycolatopsis rubida]